jgi:glycosyltransferase involved in cell wall biosynthesis
MRVVFICDFPLSGSSGRSRATRQKLLSLSKKVESLRVVAPRASILARFVFYFFSDFIFAYHLVTHRPDVVISRGFTAPILVRLLKRFEILSVREVHSSGVQEAEIIDARQTVRIVRQIIETQAFYLDRNADLRIFNHPKLLGWYEEMGLLGDHDFVTYNGFSWDAHSKLSHDEARRKFDFKEGDLYICFVGSASRWHGLDYLFALQKELSRFNPRLHVVIGGGRVASEVQTDIGIINFPGLDDRECADLIVAADACLLSVKDIRVSPGSPLKLYDYILHRKFIFAQCIIGYCDEVEAYGYGMCVDFASPSECAQQVLSCLKSMPKLHEGSLEPFSWDARMQTWLVGIQRAREIQ